MLFSLSATAQVLIDDTNTATAPNDAAVLDLNSETRGLLLPRLDNAPVNPVDGLVYYDVAEQCFKGYANGAWYALGGVCAGGPNTPPVASNVTISGDVNVGSTVTAAYDYTDAENDTENGTTYRWVALINGTETELSTDASYTIPDGAEGFELKVCVTPNDGADAGVEVCSDYSTIGAFLQPSTRINEINYDTPGTDSGEFVEVRSDAGTDVSNYQVLLYNGSDGKVYATLPLSSATTTSDGTYDYYVVTYNGIQNGSPDGVALVDGSTVIEFLSYEGGMTATNGPAQGMTSVDIGVAQNNISPDTAQRDDAGTAWFLAAGTPGAANVQVLPVPTVEFSQTSATVLENGGTYTITFNVTNAGTEDITVNISTVLNGGASAADYTTDMPATFTIPGGASSATYTFTAVDDTVEDAGESVTFTITSVSAATETPAVGANSALTVSIADDDTVVAACKTDLLFTEYYDGASNNKYVEIFNGTGAALDFTPYVIELYSGSGSGTTPSNTLDLTGTLAHNDVYVIANPSATDYPDADIKSGITFFNGDDILVLKKNGVIIDRIGATAGTNFAPADGILSRAADAQPNATYTASEWTQGTNAEHTLGSYTCTPTGPVTTNYTVSIADAAPVTEGAVQSFTVTVSPAVAAGETVVIDYVSVGGTATEDADYTAASGTLTFNAGETSQTISVTTLDDTTQESAEEYNILISENGSTVAGTVTLSVDTATGVINDNDAPSTVVTLINEDFSSITSGNNTSTNGSSSSWSGNSSFPTVDKAYQAGGAVRLGTSSLTGSITSSSLDFTQGSNDVTVTFDVKGWTTKEGDIIVTVGGVSQTVTYTAVMSGSFETKSVTFNDVTADGTVKIATSAKRAFIDNVIVTVQ